MTWTWRADLLSGENVRLRQRTGVPSRSTAKRTPTPSGQPSWVRVERVPTEESSMMLLETSAGKGLWVEAERWWWVAVNGVSEAVETEHRREIGRDGSRLRVMNSRLSVGFPKFGDGRRLRAKDWVWSCILIARRRERENETLCMLANLWRKQDKLPKKLN